MTNLSLSVVNIAYNFQLMRLAGEDGVAAYGVIMYVNFIFTSLFVGYSIGVAPIVGYHDGNENFSELKNLFKKSMSVIGLSGVILTGAALALSSPLAQIFVGYDKTLYEMTRRGFGMYSLAFFFMGFNIFGSSFLRL